MSEEQPSPTRETTAPPPPAAMEPSEVSADDKNMGMLAHLLGAFTGFLGPLIIWLMKKDESPFVDGEGKESLNFQITAIIIYFGLAVLGCVTLGLGSLLIFPVFICVLVFSILGALKAKEGIAYRYPFAIRLIK